uniref:Uncharacterized protein n=1 Tax=Moniliophthora roreri TaxID=221103 RepID=A0A0W0FEV9_MONRR
MSLFAKPERDGYTYLNASSVKQNEALITGLVIYPTVY